MNKAWHKSILFLIIILIITPLTNLVLKEAFTTTTKALHLVLFNHDDNGPYDSMQKSTQQFYGRMTSNIDTYYYCFQKDLNELFRFDASKRILYIRGQESYSPGTLDKTIKVFHYFEDHLPKYDYVVRSNISTLVDFEELLPQLDKTPIDYGGGLINELSWMDPRSGVHDETYFGTKYASGTCMIFSTDCIRRIIEKSYLMQYDLVDDLAIGVFIKNHLPYIGDPVLIHRFVFVPDLQGDEDKLKDFVQSNDPIFYRNHNGNRALDADQMSALTKIIT